MSLSGKAKCRSNAVRTRLPLERSRYSRRKDYLRIGYNRTVFRQLENSALGHTDIHLVGRMFRIRQLGNHTGVEPPPSVSHDIDSRRRSGRESKQRSSQDWANRPIPQIFQFHTYLSLKLYVMVPCWLKCPPDLLLNLAFLAACKAALRKAGLVIPKLFLISAPTTLPSLSTVISTIT